MWVGGGGGGGEVIDINSLFPSVGANRNLPSNLHPIIITYKKNLYGLKLLDRKTVKFIHCSHHTKRIICIVWVSILLISRIIRTYIGMEHT